MKKIKQILSILGFIFFFLIFSCKNNKPNPELTSLNLLRGELILCTGDQFGDVSFALSCNYDMRETFDLAISLLQMPILIVLWPIGVLP
jgi:hypothetical protein